MLYLSSNVIAGRLFFVTSSQTRHDSCPNCPWQRSPATFGSSQLYLLPISVFFGHALGTWHPTVDALTSKNCCWKLKNYLFNHSHKQLSGSVYSTNYVYIRKITRNKQIGLT